jgi:hypothetical protein
MNRLVLALSLSLFVSPAFTQGAKPDDTMKDCPMHDQHAAHHATVERNGDQAMGFPHDKTSHHFRISSDGGTIEVTANDSSDKTDIGAIRSHLSHIAAMFNNGDFSTPMFVHDGVPPGVTTMKLMKSTIRYAYEEIPSGGRIQVKSDDPVGVASIHDFLRFQIADHQTGDSLEVGQK